MSADQRRPDISVGSKPGASPQVQPSAPKGPALEFGKGLDIGTANLISAMQDREGNLYIKSQRNAFIDIDQDDFTRNMLTKLGVQYVILSNRMVVVGDPAFELANIFNRETRRPMARGVLSSDEEDALPIMKLLIEKLLGQPQKPEELAYFSVPANPIDFKMNALYHEKMFEDLLTRIGYKAKALIEGHAVVLAELAEDDFTGIGISCGGGMFNVCVAFNAVNVVSFSTARGGDWVDENVAQVLGIKKSKATAIKEKGVDLRKPKNREQQAVEIYYRDLIQYTLRNIKERFEKKSDRPEFPNPVDLVLAGGTSMIGGFEAVVQEELGKLAFPIPIKNVRVAEDPLHSVAKGCLVAAMSELST